MNASGPVTLHTVGPEDDGLRLDRFCAARHPGTSRSRLTALIRDGKVLVDGRPARPSDAVKAGHAVWVEIPPPVDERLVPEDIPLTVLYEDDALLVLDKPAGLVVHPGAGVREGTLAAALLHHDPAMAGVGGEGRSGLVHRLDKGTSGVMVVARTPAAHEALAAQFRTRRVEKIYEAIVWGRPREREGTIDVPVGRDPRSRVRMAAHGAAARAAESRYRVVEEVPGFALVRVKILTGRTHQVRVHLGAIGHPLVGDVTYAGDRSAQVADVKRRAAIRALDRPALHALRLAFDHPFEERRMKFEARWPDDMRALWAALRGGAG